MGQRRPPSLPGHGEQRGKWSASPHSGWLLCMKETPLSLKGICLLASPRLASLSCCLLRIQNRFGSVRSEAAKCRINGIVGTFKWHSWGYPRPHLQQLAGVGECHGGNLAFPVVLLPRLDSSVPSRLLNGTASALSCSSRLFEVWAQSGRQGLLCYLVSTHVSWFVGLLARGQGAANKVCAFSRVL